MVLVVSSMKMLRNAFCAPHQMYLNLLLCELLFAYDFYRIGEAFAVNYLLISILLTKVRL